MRKTELPVQIPPITGYLHHGLILSIAMAYEELMPWFHSNYIQLRCFRYPDDSRGTDFLNFFTMRSAFHHFPCLPYLEFQEFKTSLLKQHNINLHQYVMDSIDEGQYIIMYVDLFYIPDTIYYQKKHHTSETLIYGYDEEKQVYLNMDFNAEHIFTYKQIPYADLENSYEKTEFEFFWQKYTFAIEFTGFPPYELNLDFIIESLEDYLNSYNSSLRFTMVRMPWTSEECAYGMEIYELMEQYLQFVKLQQAPPDIRFFHILWEHKKCMMLRASYLEEVGVLDKALSFTEKFSDINDKALHMRNLLLRYQMTSEADLIDSALELSVQLKESEKEAMELLLAELKAKHV
ncbi:hypothetical protein H8B09_10260 [Paenibacillus sp. PR3]|uniref:Butirosin biosynthesis protein H N-terminal domain-containing protein n=1 Tax=Paenibacillus terricola TaxID=2763503 RepID=A0ABR8MT42_9BACL|nr:hypothetical protein [Paenibacillus terricola]MBD3919138.1 hypothetical protein [Paenibacillus terricola]